jgi:hypothetical protein
MEKVNPEISKAYKNCEFIFWPLLISIIIIIYGVIDHYLK